MTAVGRRRRPMRRILAWLILVGGLAGLTAWLHANPTIAAYGCPRCFGLERLAEGIWIEPVLDARGRADLIASREAARASVAAVFGALQSAPVLLVCATKECDRRLGGRGARAITIGWQIVRVSPRGANSVVLAHELTHTELHYRIGPWAWLKGAYPAWFDEGLAVLISRDPRFLDVGGFGAPRCRGDWSEADFASLPTASSRWMQEALQTRYLYARAACKVARWYAAAGRHGLMELIAELRAGAGFDAAFARERGQRLPAAAPSG